MSSKVAALPVEASGDYGTSRFNALKHGLLSRYLVLPWEDETEYRTTCSLWLRRKHLHAHCTANAGRKGRRP